MDKKFKSIVGTIMCVILALAFSAFLLIETDVDMASGSALPWWPGFPEIVAGNESVAWNFTVVAGVNTSSPSFTPEPSPPGFSFTVVDGELQTGGDGPGPVPGGFDFGKILWTAAEGWLNSKGWVEVNITNNLGCDIVVTNLTAEVTAGPETDPFIHPYLLDACNSNPGAYNQTSNATCPWVATMANFSLVKLETLDPVLDEVDYYAGNLPQGCMHDLPTDSLTMDMGQINPATGKPWKPWAALPTGPGTLLGPDAGGDAAATGHVAPILLRAGETFNEFFGVGIFGNATSGTQIIGTITLNLTYRRVSVPNYLEVVKVSVLYKGEPITQAYNTWTVDVEVTVKNLGTAPIDANVSLYGLTATTGNLTHWSGGTLEQVGTVQTITGLAGGANTTLTFSWDLSTAPKPPDGAPSIAVPFRAIAWSQGSLHYDEKWSQIDIILWGDVNLNGRVDLGDIGKVILVYSGIITGPTRPRRPLRPKRQRPRRPRRHRQSHPNLQRRTLTIILFFNV